MLLACSPLDTLGKLVAPTPSGERPGTTATPGEPPEGEEGVGAELTEEDIFPAEDPEPLPFPSLFEAMQARVDDGTWTEGEAIVAVLKIIAGEVSFETSFGDTAIEPSDGTGVLLAARSYLETGSDMAAKAEIERLLGSIVPSMDRLLPYARPEGEASVRPSGLAAPVKADEVCAQLYKDGFPAGSGEVCFLYTQVPLDAYEGRVFYPSSWGSDPAKLEYAHASAQAILDSWAVYNDFGVIKQVDLVFSLLAETTSPLKTAAEVPTQGGATTCLIVVFPLALSENLPVFKQTIAHEMFHCFQQWNFANKFPGNWAVQDWWGEATADYFSNVVYPATQAEWGSLGTFNQNSAEHSLVDMSYENWIFFQFLANKVGNQGVLELVKLMPASGGEAEQAAALILFANIETLFHQFGRDYVDVKIEDAKKGTMVPTGYLMVPKKFQIPIGDQEHQVSLLNTLPFTLTRYGLTFKTKRLIGVATEETGTPGNYGSRLVFASPNWSPLPPAVAGCGATKWYVLVTSTSPAGNSDPYTVSVTSDVKQETECDECLNGTWDLDIPSFRQYISTPFPAGSGFELGDTIGTWRYVFHPIGQFLGQFAFAMDYSITVQGAFQPIVTEVLITANGDGSALYWVPSKGTLASQLLEDNVVFDQYATMNGDPVDAGFGPIFSPMPATTTAGTTYTCNATTLALQNAGAESAGLPPVLYNRVNSNP